MRFDAEVFVVSEERTKRLDAFFHRDGVDAINQFAADFDELGGIFQSDALVFNDGIHLTLVEMEQIIRRKRNQIKIRGIGGNNDEFLGLRNRGS